MHGHSDTPRHYTPTIVKQHIGPNTTHRIYHFENGYGASVIPEYEHDYAYDYNTDYRLQPSKDLWELAMLKYAGQGDIHDDSNWSLYWDSDITDRDVVRYLTQDQVDELLDRIAGL